MMMGLGVGSLVWVQRKNGSWWPGKIVGRDQLLSSPLQFSSPSSSSAVEKTPIKLLGKQNGSVEWFNLEKSKRIKAFRSSEFDCFIKNAESVQASPAIRIAKYAHHADAVLHALQLEKQQLEKSVKTPGNVQQQALCRAKRSRCVYLPVESNHSAQYSVLHSQSSKVFPSACLTKDHSGMSSLAAKEDSSESRVFDFSKNSFEDDDGDGVKQHTGSCGNGRQKRSMISEKDNLRYSSESSLESKIAGGAGSQNWDMNEPPYMQNPNASSALSRKRTRNIQDILVLDSPFKDERSCRFSSKSAEFLALEVKRLFHSPSGSNYLEDSDNLCHAPVCNDHQNMKETMLMDVAITVQGNYRKEHVPLVSLMSKLNKKAIVGHPIDVEVLKDKSDVYLGEKNSVNHIIDNADSKGHQLVWRTSKRTPVCYITNPHSPATGEKGEQASKTFGNSNLEAKTNNIPQEEESLFSAPKKGNISEKNGYNHRITNQSSKTVSLKGATCVPVKLIFTKLFFAVGT